MLKAGAGKAAIQFPDALFPLEGFCCVHDEPYARILLLESENRAVIAALELVMLPETILEDLKTLIERITGAPRENIWIHVTHAITTPHAPGGPMIGPGGRSVKETPLDAEVPSGAEMRSGSEVRSDAKVPSGVEQELEGGEKADLYARERCQYRLYEKALNTAVSCAAALALETLEEAFVGVGEGLCDINCNRDIQTPYGWWIGTGGNGMSNKQLSLIKFETMKGQPIAFLMSYGIKPCAIDNSQMTENKRQVSSDVPGRACRQMEQTFNAPVLFLMSAAGDQIPKEQAWYDTVLDDGTVKTIDRGVEQGLCIVEKLGDIMAGTAMAMARQIKCMEITQLNILKTAFDWPTKERIELHPRKTFEFTTDGKKAAVPVEVILLGPIAFVATMPEVNCITERELKQLSPFKYTFLATMVNGGMKYMPDQQSYENITWEAINSMLMPKAAEAFVQEAVKLMELNKDCGEYKCGTPVSAVPDGSGVCEKGDYDET